MSKHTSKLQERSNALIYLRVTPQSEKGLYSRRNTALVTNELNKKRLRVKQTGFQISPTRRQLPTRPC